MRARGIDWVEAEWLGADRAWHVGCPRARTGFSRRRPPMEVSSDAQALATPCLRPAAAGGVRRLQHLTAPPHPARRTPRALQRDRGPGGPPLPAPHNPTG